MKELRVGLVLYGGVSLAVYMNGIVTELWNAVRASKAFRVGSKANLTGTAIVYYDLLERLGTEPDAEPLCIVVDAVSGTSAGGLNGAVLAKAVVEGADASVLSNVWIEDADIAKLKAKPRRAPFWLRAAVWSFDRIGAVARLRRAANAVPGLGWSWLRDTLYALATAKDGRITPLNGSYFAQMIANTFKNMSSAPATGTLLPDLGSFDLFLTRTDLHGWPRHLPVSQTFHRDALFERTHAHVMVFRKRPSVTLGDSPAAELAHDFDLTFATRTTAGFPVAFAPVAHGDVAADYETARPCEAATPLDVFARRHLHEHELMKFPTDRARMVDGGILDNRPFSHTTQAIENKPADRRVYRMLAYIEPDPETEIDKPPLDMPRFLGVLKSLWALFRHEPIYGDLRRLQRRNAKVEQIRGARDAALPGAIAAAQRIGGLSWPPNVNDLQDWRRATNDAAARTSQTAYPGYVMIKARRAADTVAEVIAGALDYPYDSRHAYFVRTLVRGWLRQEGALDAPVYIEGEGYHLEEVQRSLLGAFDRSFHIRRVRALVARINEAYSDPRADSDVLDKAKEILAQIAYAYEAPLEDMDVVREQITGLLGGIDTDTIDDAIDELQYDPEAAVVRHRDQLAGLYEGLRDRYKMDGRKHYSRFADVLSELPEWAQEALGKVLAAFPFIDIAIFPQMDAAGVSDLINVETMRISPQDATFLSQDPKRLKSREMGAFAGFLYREAREHDLMWGRLDGAERLIELIFKAAANNSAAGNAHGGALPPRLETLRRSFTRCALAVVLEEEGNRGGSRIGEVVEELKETLAALP